jgi:putative nucleotidyltransferase with HDIG domain
LFIQNEVDLFQEQFQPDRLIDQITSPFMREELLARTDALIRVRRVIHRSGVSNMARDDDGTDSGREGKFTRLGRQVTAILGSRVPRYSKPLGPYAEVAARVADWADRRDGMEQGHAERVTMFCNMICEGLRLPRDQANSLLRAAMLHDIGKVAIPVELLQKEGPLEEDQMRLMRTHPQKGAALMRALDRDEDVVRTILYHHERPDGTGYYGKSGRAVPVTSRVLAVAETYDAMTRSQVRAQVTPEDALEYLKLGRGHMYDADCVDALSDVLQPRSTSIPLSNLGY